MESKQENRMLESVVSRDMSQLNINDKTEKCLICRRAKTDKCQLKKCYHNDCKNTFCNDCHLANHFQVRNPTVNCKYFVCDKGCGEKKICIMASLFCQNCDVRICSNCYKSNHSSHGNIKYHD